MWADKKGVDVGKVAGVIGASQGPVLTGTAAQANKFHDDKSLYTGVHAKGGPSTVDTGTSDLSNITNRADADVRGINKADAVPTASHKVAGVVVDKDAAAATKKMAGMKIEEEKKEESMPAESL